MRDEKMTWKKDEKVNTKDSILGIIYAIIFFSGCAVIWGSISGIITAGKVMFRDHYAIGTVRYVTDAPSTSPSVVTDYDVSYDQNIQVTLDEPVNDDWVYSITYFNTSGKAIFKGQRAMVFYNDFDGNDGIVVSFAGLIYRGVSFAICVIGGVIAILMHRFKSKKVVSNEGNALL